MLNPISAGVSLSHAATRKFETVPSTYTGVRRRGFRPLPLHMHKTNLTAPAAGPKASSSRQHLTSAAARYFTDERMRLGFSGPDVVTSALLGHSSSNCYPW